MERSVALGQISARYPHVAAISGCHGKTTITSMLAYINEEAKLDATVHVGGFVDLLDGGVKVGTGTCSSPRPASTSAASSPWCPRWP